MRLLITVPAVVAALFVAACDDPSTEAEVEPVGGDLEQVGEPVGEVEVPEGAATPASGGIAGWDTNQDRRIDPAEFQGGAKQAMWSAWDVDNDGLLTEEEYLAGMYTLWDTNADGAIDEQEWKTRAQPWFEARRIDAGEWSDWSTDEVIGVSRDELQRGWAERDVNVFEEWDADTSGGLDEAEWGRGWFETWDADQDGYLGDDEQGYWR